MNFLIVGLGAVGTILSSCLKLKGNDKIFAVKSKKSMKTEFDIKLDVIENLKDEIKIKPNPVYQYENQDIDIAFVTLKSNYLKNSKDIFSNLKKKNAKIVCLMNGMGYEDFFKGFEIYYGIIMYNAFRKDDKVVLGSKGGLILEKSLENILKDKFDFIPYSFVEDIDSYRYRKLWLNTINGFLSLFGFSLHQFFYESQKLENKPLLALKKYLIETKELFDKLDITTTCLPSLDPQTLIDLIDKIVKKEKLNEKEEKLYNNLPKGKNSTLQSIESKVDTEYEYLGGYLIKLADKVNYPYTINRFVTEKILQYDKSKNFEYLKLTDILQFI